MSKRNDDVSVGTVTECLPNALYRVAIDGGTEVLCYVAGKMKRAKVTVGIQDRVEVVVDPYGGKTTNRIVWRI